MPLTKIKKFLPALLPGGVGLALFALVLGWPPLRAAAESTVIATQGIGGKYGPWQVTGPGGGGVPVTPSTTVAAPCSNFIAVNQTSSTTVITGTAAKKIYICSIVLLTATTQNVSVVEGTGTVCASGTPVGVLGGTTASMSFNAGGGLVSTAATPWFVERTAADNICVVQSGVGNVSGGIFYAVQ